MLFVSSQQFLNAVIKKSQTLILCRNSSIEIDKFSRKASISTNVLLEKKRSDKTQNLHCKRLFFPYAEESKTENFGHKTLKIFTKPQFVRTCKLLCSPEMVLPTKGDDKELKEIIYQNNLEHCLLTLLTAQIRASTYCWCYQIVFLIIQIIKVLGSQKSHDIFFCFSKGIYIKNKKQSII